MSPRRRGKEDRWYTGSARAEDRATLESDPSADTSAINWAGTERFCPFCFCPVFWPESDKLIVGWGSIGAKGRDLRNGFAIEMGAIGPPRVVGCRRFGEWHSLVEMFGIHDLRLPSQLFVGGVGKGLVLVKDGAFFFGIF